MELSVLIARITSVVYLSAALGAVFSRDHYRRLLDDLFKNAALTYLMGFTAVILGFLMVNYHNTWGKDWTVLINILGWLALMKGVLIIAFPGLVHSYSKAIFEGRGLQVFPYVAAFLGLVFGYFGFVH
jgi:vacuolar-type H+-ATPase subunit I/STV1